LVKNRTAIYCRISTEEKEAVALGRESESIHNQKMLLLSYAKKQNWEVYQIYIDEDYSGLEEQRPAFQKMLEDAREGKFSIILCKTQSRFTRNMEVAEKYLHHYFILWNIRFIAIVDHVDTSQKENKKERQILGLMNEWYCEEISDNIRSVFRKKMEQGQFIGNFAPYGYKKDSENRHHLLIDEESASIVQTIYMLYIEKGLSCKKIAQSLTAQGIPTPWQRKVEKGEDLGRKNVKNPGVWAETTIRKILQNRVYVGDMVQGREKKISFKEKKVCPIPKTDWIIVENTHEPIISREIFEKAQILRKQRKKIDKDFIDK
jgi:DNA invertase Pin-like site-specific DNA recombinase